MEHSGSSVWRQLKFGAIIGWYGFNRNVEEKLSQLGGRMLGSEVGEAGKQ